MRPSSLSSSSTLRILRPSTLLRPFFSQTRSFSDSNSLKINFTPADPPSPSEHLQHHRDSPQSLTDTTELEDLPVKLPDAPPYPCPWITSDAQGWLKPLYQRGWRVLRSPESPHVIGSFALEKQFRFKTHKSTIGCLDELMRLDNGICEQEGHHPFELRLTYSGIFVALKTSNALVLSTERQERSPRKPGVTLRDIRLAILIQRLFEKASIPGGGIHSRAPSTMMHLDIRSVKLEQLEAEHRELEQMLKG